MASIKLYNFLSRKKEFLKPIRKEWVGLYTCGPTVYSFAHIGNLRTYIFEDVLRRTLEYAGYTVRQVMNITDVDDKIIRGATSAGKNIFECVKPYEKAFFEDLQKLHVKDAWKYPKATEHIKEMIKVIEALLQKGIAYRQNDSIYFDISKFKKYGALSRLRRIALKTGTRVSLDEYSKKDIRDFALWKTARSGEPSWDAPFGRGRPGWHIECSAMSMKYLGPTFDIHAGGVDLLFPHHENEIAQSEGATGRKFVRFFVEGEHLLVNGEKMSKSLGNIFTLRDIESRGLSPLAFRYLTLTTHYRSKLNFTWESLGASQQSLERLYDFVRSLHSVPILDRHTYRSYRSKIGTTGKRFEAAVSNDLDTPKALALIWQLINRYHKKSDSLDPRAILTILYDFDRVLGLGLKDVKPEKIPQKILALTEQREAYRKEKKWKEADQLRKKIEARGYRVQDSLQGPRVIQEKASGALLREY